MLHRHVYAVGDPPLEPLDYRLEGVLGNMSVRAGPRAGQRVRSSIFLASSAISLRSISSSMVISAAGAAEWAGAGFATLTTLRFSSLGDARSRAGRTQSVFCSIQRW